MERFETTTDLLTKQIEAVNKLLPSRVGGLLSDPGTGKTRTALELIKIRHNKIDKVVWFCPVTLKDTVFGEILKHTTCPREDIYVFDDKTKPSRVPEARFYIIGIESMSFSQRVIVSTYPLITENTFVVLDESTYCKTHNALRTERITHFSRHSRYRMILNGLLLDDGIKDLFAQMYFLSEKILGYSSFYSFQANHLEYSDIYPGKVVRAHNVEYLSRKMAPYVYQYKREGLPEKRYDTRYFKMTEQQRYYYEYEKERAMEELDEVEYPSVIIFRLFSILQRIVSGYYQGHEIAHSRVESTLDVIERHPHEKQIIFTKYRNDVEQIGRALEAKYGKEAVAYYHGGIKTKDRPDELKKFRTHSQFLVTTMSTVGHGLTLTECAYAIFYNNSFKLRDRVQPEDRIHRIGQTRDVLYTDIHCLDSIDDVIYKAISKKENIQESFTSQIMRMNRFRLKNLIKAL